MGLTKHNEGSLRELWSLSLPLMLSSFSMMAMLFIDRLLLARYSTHAFNAAVNAATLGWAFTFGWMILASIAEVFVAQYNGAGKRNILGEPVWQMIWLALGSLFFFIPLAMWGGEWFFGTSPHQALERDYFRWMMYFGSSYPLYGALCGFFIGQGKTRLITILAIVANIVNALLDIILIFGIEGLIPSLGIKGAAIATNISCIFQAAILGYIFLSKNNQQEHGTAAWHFRPRAFWQCIRVGFPSALFVAVEVLGWAVFYWMMTMVGETHITVVGICQSVAILFYFFAEGVNKAVTTISGNLIGAQRLWIVPKVIKVGLKLHLLFFLALLLIFWGCTDIFINQFLPNASEEVMGRIYDPLVTCLIFIIFYMLFEGVRLLLAGVLTAAGDTFFLLVAGSLSVWLLMVLPVYFFVVQGEAPVEVASLICVFYGLGACLIYYLRFLQGKWRTISLVDTSRIEPVPEAVPYP